MYSSKCRDPYNSDAKIGILTIEQRGKKRAWEIPEAKKVMVKIRCLE